MENFVSCSAAMQYLDDHQPLLTNYSHGHAARKQVDFLDNKPGLTEITEVSENC
jgi:hypothetical protein